MHGLQQDMALRNFLVLICERCNASMRVPRTSLPHCPICDPKHERPPAWRHALDGEYTVSDLRLLKSLQIASE